MGSAGTMISLSSPHSVTSGASSGTPRNHGITAPGGEAPPAGSTPSGDTLPDTQEETRKGSWRRRDCKALLKMRRWPGAQPWKCWGSALHFCVVLAGEVVRSQVGWQGHAGRSPGPEDHTPGSPLLRPATGMFQETVWTVNSIVTWTGLRGGAAVTRRPKAFLNSLLWRNPEAF